jgi:two-component system, chemotaxis family, protein-glutamate methylesterase/glutaminase
VAAPGRHLLLTAGVAELSDGRRFHHTRPAVDVMSASAARWIGDRVVAVVLPGSLDDGAAGAALVARAGGLVAGQEPGETPHPSMPRAALAMVPGACAVPATKPGEVISGMMSESGAAAWDRSGPQRLAPAQAGPPEAGLWAAVAVLEEAASAGLAR